MTTNRNETPCHTLLNHHLNYDEWDGTLTWRVPTNHRIREGDLAGHVTCYGYLNIKMFGVSYPASRLIYKMMMHEEPGESMDHINNIKLDNRWCNLRSVTQWENQQNRIDTKRNGGTLRSKRERKVAQRRAKRISVLKAAIELQRATNACKEP